MINIKTLVQKKINKSNPLNLETNQSNNVDLCLSNSNSRFNKNNPDLCDLFNGILGGFLGQGTGLVNSLISGILNDVLLNNRKLISILRPITNTLTKNLATYNQMEALLNEILDNNSVFSSNCAQVSRFASLQMTPMNLYKNQLKILLYTVPNLFSVNQYVEDEVFALERIKVTTQRLSSSNFFSNLLNSSNDEDNVNGIGCVKIVINFIRDRRRALESMLDNLIRNTVDVSGFSNSIANTTGRTINDYTLNLSNDLSLSTCAIVNSTRESISEASKDTNLRIRNKLRASIGSP